MKIMCMARSATVAAAVAAMSFSSLLTAGVTDQDILNDAKTTGDIVSYGLGTHGQRYSPLKIVNDKTYNRYHLFGRFPLVVKNSVGKNHSR